MLNNKEVETCLLLYILLSRKKTIVQLYLPLALGLLRRLSYQIYQSTHRWLCMHTAVNLKIIIQGSWSSGEIILAN